MRHLTGLAIAGTLALGSAAFAQAPAEKGAAPATAPAPATTPAAATAAAPAAKLSPDAKVSALLADAKAKAVLQKHVPLIVENAPQYPEVLEMSLRDLSKIEMAQSAGGLTEEAFKKIETELKAL